MLILALLNLLYFKINWKVAVRRRNNEYVHTEVFLYHNLGHAVRKIAGVQNTDSCTDTNTKTRKKPWAAIWNFFLEPFFEAKLLPKSTFDFLQQESNPVKANFLSSLESVKPLSFLSHWHSLLQVAWCYLQEKGEKEGQHCPRGGVERWSLGRAEEWSLLSCNKGRPRKGISTNHKSRKENWRGLLFLL